MTVDAYAIGGGVLAAVAGWGGGLGLLSVVSRLVDPAPARRVVAARWAPVLAAALAAMLWWWEVPCRGLTAADVESQDAAVAAARVVFHGGLLLLLAAASWVDFRHRVIPDAITVPGLLIGLGAATALPQVLLPVAREVPRSFAPPLRLPDVLGACGPLHGEWPARLGPAPVLTGLAAAAAVFLVWWLVGTDPEGPGGEGRAWPSRLLTPRALVAVVGAVIIGVAWLVGGDHWRAVVSALAGLAVAGGLIWLTRAGASRALGREAMGFGDVTLMAMVGAWLGWQPCVIACFLAVFIGLAHGVVQLAVHGEAELPFGPSLCLGAAATVVAWRPLWARTEPFFREPFELAAVVVVVIALTAVTLWIWHRLRPISAG
ncbi:MAG: prepilin peptidase [Planctomycetaceae bacterium]